MKRIGLCAAAAACLAGLCAPAAFAQGGGASTTGTIQGRVTDTSGGVLPGVSVTATSPSQIGVQVQVTNENGLYRFPAVPPGVYALSFELPGFNTVQRTGIQVLLGFTATVNVELPVAALQETVTVTGASPVIDTSATRVQQNFKLEQLNSIPNARDMWALLAATPGVVMSRIDVAGNRAGTQTGYTAYGLSGQVRVSVEGINTTEGTSGAGFYFDYGSFEEVFLGVAGQGAEAATPGVQSQFLGRSGGDRFSGELYVDGYTDVFQASNLTRDHIERFGLRAGSNEVLRYYDVNVNVGGPIRRGKAWWHTAWRKQFNSVDQPLFTFDAEFETWNTNPSVKTTYQASQHHRLIGYFQWNMKTQPTRLPFGGYTYETIGPTTRQESPSWVWKGEWNATLSDRFYVEARAGDFGYYDVRLANSTEDYFWRDSGTLQLTGAATRSQNDRDRFQITGAGTYFLDTRRGSHTIKFGGELYFESQWGGNEQRVGGHIEHVYTNGRASQVIFGIPTARAIGGLKNRWNGDLLVVNKLDQQDLFISDTWTLGRLTLNLGARWDRYRAWMPEQRQIAFAIGPVSIPEEVFPARTFFVWNSFAPRVGVTYDLDGTGRTVLKSSYGLFWHNPGPGIGAGANPNQTTKSVTYNWTDLNGDRRFQMGEQGALTASSLAGNLALADELRQPYSHDVTLYLERQIAAAVGARVGYVYKSEDDLIANYRPFRPIEAYTAPFSFLDVGPDGRAGTGDDRTLTLYGLPAAQQAQFPTTVVVMNVPRFSRYHTVEASMIRRGGDRWSLQAGGSHTWAHDFPEGYPNDPNAPADERATRWDFKLSGTYDGPWQIRVAPLLRHQAGANFARTISVGSAAAAAVGAIYSGTIYAEPRNARRLDNITVLDLRVERSIRLAGTLRARAMLDLFNITNSSAAEVRTVATGASFLRPTAVLAPRTVRLAARLSW